jgi:hypothetical protein
MAVGFPAKQPPSVYQQQDEDTVQLCRLCSRLFEGDDRASFVIRTYEAIGRRGILPIPLASGATRSAGYAQRLSKRFRYPLRAN